MPVHSLELRLLVFTDQHSWKVVVTKKGRDASQQLTPEAVMDVGVGADECILEEEEEDKVEEVKEEDEEDVGIIISKL